eukprot:760952-Hanusia_phi.AAC.2
MRRWKEWKRERGEGRRGRAKGQSTDLLIELSRLEDATLRRPLSGATTRISSSGTPAGTRACMPWATSEEGTARGGCGGGGVRQRGEGG